MTDANLELQHLWLDIQHQRWQQLPRFFFSYFCYQHQYVDNKNKPCWETARQQLPSSLSASQRQGAIIEPLIPESVIVGLLKTQAKQSALCFEKMVDILEKHLHYVVISSEQKQRLSPTMPAMWYKKEPKTLLDRFEQAGIELLD